MNFDNFFFQAKRANISTVILPEGNRKDYDDLQNFIKQNLEVHFVSDYDNVYEIALNYSESNAKQCNNS